jgi:hypothetical protein
MYASAGSRLLGFDEELRPYHDRATSEDGIAVAVRGNTMMN